MADGHSIIRCHVGLYFLERFREHIIQLNDESLTILMVRLVAGHQGQDRPLASSIVSPILRNNWNNLVPTLDPKTNNLI
jgi:hypothetical protein